MNDRKPTEPLAKVVLQRHTNKNDDIIDIDGDEGQLVQLLAQAFGEFPQLIELFEKSLRYYKSNLNRKHN